MRNYLFNKTSLFLLAAAGVMVMVFVAIKVQTAQRNVTPSPQAAALPVGVAIATPGGFQVQLDHAQLDTAMRQTQLATKMDIKISEARQVAKPKYANLDSFQNAVETEATSKLRQLFPKGVPPGMESRVKITITVKSADPLDISIKVEL